MTPDEHGMYRLNDVWQLGAAHLLIARGKTHMPSDQECEGITLVQWVLERGGITAAELRDAVDEFQAMSEDERGAAMRMADPLILIDDQNTEVNMHDMQCPSCGDNDHIHIEGSVYVRLYADGHIDHDDIEWIGTSPARCDKCGFMGQVQDFEPDSEECEP